MSSSVMSKIKIDPVRESFKKIVSASLSLANGAQHFKEPRGARGRYVTLMMSRQYLVVELSFLRLYTSWEEFLEQTFIRYMCGAITSSGYSPKRFVQSLTLNHASDICTQGRAYVDWTRLNEVLYKSKLYFKDGEPFKTALGSASAVLEEMKIVRNRIAHRSEHTDSMFSQLVINRLGVRQKNMVPGRFLVMISRRSGIIFFQEYANTLLTICDLIVP